MTPSRLRTICQVYFWEISSRPAVWRWQQRFAEAGVDRLLRDRTRKRGKPRTADRVVRTVVALTYGEPPSETTHWTGRAMAEATGLFLRTVQRIWAAHDRKRSFVATLIFPTSPLAVVWFAQQGITVRWFMADNGVGYRSHLRRQGPQRGVDPRLPSGYVALPSEGVYKILRIHGCPSTDRVLGDRGMVRIRGGQSSRPVCRSGRPGSGSG